MQITEITGPLSKAGSYIAEKAIWLGRKIIDLAKYLGKAFRPAFQYISSTATKVWNYSKPYLEKAVAFVKTPKGAVVAIAIGSVGLLHYAASQKSKLLYVALGVMGITGAIFSGALAMKVGVIGAAQLPF